MISTLIIGAGKLGTTLFLGLNKFQPGNHNLYSNHTIPDSGSPEGIRDYIITNLSDAITQKSDFIFICVQDYRISEIVKILLNYNLAGKKIVHTSGIKDSGLLTPLKQQGSYTGSWHPVQTFKGRFLEPDIWHEIICTFEGDPELQNDLKSITKMLGSELLPVSIDQKKSIHLAAVVAANYQVGLLAWANQILGMNGIPEKTGKKLLHPLTAKVLDNYQKNPVHTILTGPLYRGDVESISGHMRILKDSGHPEWINLYKQLGLSILNDDGFKIGNTEKLKKTLEEQC